MQITREGIERIKSANELAAIVAERGIEVRRKGKSLVASCPFHEEKTPSFTITPSKGLFHCFGCGASGDVIGFVSRYDKVAFPEAMESLAKRAGLSLPEVMRERPRAHRKNAKKVRSLASVAPSELLGRVVEHYHKTLCEREDAQEYLRSRGLDDAQLVLDFKLGYADGSLLKRVPKGAALRDELVTLGVITEAGRELLGGCIVVPIPDPVSGEWTSLYGRGMKTARHCYLPGPLRGVVNYQAARSSSEIVLTESVLDALSFYQAGVRTAIPIYGTNGFTQEHLDLLKRENVRRVILALDADEAGRKATEALTSKLLAAGIEISHASFPEGVNDPNELLVARNGDAGDVFQKLIAEASPVKAPSSPSSKTAHVRREDGQLVLGRDDVCYRARVYPPQLGRLRATIKVEKDERFHVDTLDLYASRSRSEFGRRVSKALELDEDDVESDLLALVVEAEKMLEEGDSPESSKPPPMSQTERDEALSFLRRQDLLDQVAKDIDTLGYVGEEMNKRLLYLVAISRKLQDPLSAVILSQSGAGKSGLTEVIERLTPPEDVVLLTRLTPQSLYYVDDAFLDQKLVIIEERYGSMEADYSIRVLQSRKKLIAAAPVKDPQTGNMRTKVFSVEARAAFIEATTASAVNHENATRCFELTMDESIEQTERIHERQRFMRTEAGAALGRHHDGIVRRHWNAQRLLEPMRVVIPFASELRFPTTWMRTRRDHARFLNLIEVSTFLHQHQRQKRDGVLVAAVDDYEIAYELAAEILTDTFSDLKRCLKDAYERIRKLCDEGEGTVSRREIRDALGLADSTVRGWLTELVELEYLVFVDGGGRGKPVRYGLHERAPAETLVLGLLKPHELKEKFASSRKNANAVRDL